MTVEYRLDSAESRRHFDEMVSQMLLAGKVPVVQFVGGVGSRTNKQNAAMWRLFRIVSQMLQSAGIDAREFFKPEVEIPVTPEMLHEEAFNKISDAMYGKTSSQLSKHELSDVGEVFIRHLAQSHGISVDWPSEEAA